MLRLIKLLVLLGVFLGGYYVGQQPDSPDIIGAARTVYQRMRSADGEKPAKAEAQAPATPAADCEDASLTEAALAYLRDKAARTRQPTENQDLWGYPRPTGRNRR